MGRMMDYSQNVIFITDERRHKNFHTGDEVNKRSFDEIDDKPDDFVVISVQTLTFEDLINWRDAICEETEQIIE